MRNKKIKLEKIFIFICIYHFPVECYTFVVLGFISNLSLGLIILVILGKPLLAFPIILFSFAS